jgi:hypothetical protein
MPRYYFTLNTGARVVSDSEGTELADEAAAHAEAAMVARDIMRNNRSHTMSWRLQVADEQRVFCFELLFANADEELQAFPERMRDTVTQSAHRLASLNDDINAIQRSLRQVRATLARADRMPYLAAVNGTRVDR